MNRTKSRQNTFSTELTWHHLFPLLVQVMRQKEVSIALARIGDEEDFTNEELCMIESQFMAEALYGDPHGVRLFFANRDMESFNTQDAMEGMPEMRAMKARDKICGYCNPEERNKAMEKIEQMTLTEMGNLPARFVSCISKPYMITVNIDVRVRPWPQHKYNRIR